MGDLGVYVRPDPAGGDINYYIVPGWLARRYMKDQSCYECGYGDVRSCPAVLFCTDRDHRPAWAHSTCLPHCSSSSTVALHPEVTDKGAVLAALAKAQSPSNDRGKVTETVPWILRAPVRWVLQVAVRPKREYSAELSASQKRTRTSAMDGLKVNRSIAGA
jgi:hypothetical protein